MEAPAQQLTETQGQLRAAESDLGKLQTELDHAHDSLDSSKGGSCPQVSVLTVFLLSTMSPRGSADGWAHRFPLHFKPSPISPFYLLSTAKKRVYHEHILEQV